MPLPSAEETRAALLRVLCGGAPRRRGRRPRTLVVGNYGNGNIGDDAILAALVQLAAGQVDLSVLTRRPAELAHAHDVRAVAMRPWPLVRALVRSDRLAIGGGGMFGRGMPWRVSVLPWLAWVFTLTGRSASFLAIGAYSDMPGHARLGLRLLARRLDAITARDAATVRFLGPRAALVRDPAELLAPAPPRRVRELLAAVGVDSTEPYLVVSVKALADREDESAGIAAVAAAVTDWSSRGLPVVVLALSKQGDFGHGAPRADAELARSLPRADGRAVPVVGPAITPSEAKGVVAGARAVVGMRLHAHIFAAATGVPSLAVGGEHKLRLFAVERGIDQLAPTAPRGAVPAWLHAHGPIAAQPDSGPVGPAVSERA